MRSDNAVASRRWEAAVIVVSSCGMPSSSMPGARFAHTAALLRLIAESTRRPAAMPKGVAQKMKSILDPTFRYRPSFATDLEKTFARARRQQRKSSRPESDQTTARCASVSPLVRKTATA